jgi:hypothetical protein
MALRAALGLPLFDAQDAAMPEGQGLQAVCHRNGELLGHRLVQVLANGRLRVLEECDRSAEAPRPPRASVLARRADDAYRHSEAERKRRERVRRRQEEDEAGRREAKHHARAGI